MNAQVFPGKVVSRLLLAVALALTVVAGPASPPQATARSALSAHQLIVDRTDDASGLLCITANPNDCSLRSAIEVARADPGDTYDVVFADNYTITLGSALPVITTTMSIRGQGSLSETRIININANGNYNVLKIDASNVHIDHLYLYGASGGYSNIWIAGSAKNVVISHNVIGSSLGGPCNDTTAYGGIYINSTGALTGSDKRAWIYANEIVCHQSTTGEGITIWGTDGVAIGEDADGNAGAAQSNQINNNRVGVAIRENAGENTVRNSYINNNLDVGVLIRSSKGNTVRGNWIVYNSHNGVQVEDAMSNIIGYLTSEPFTPGNLVSNNGEYGVVITGTTAASNQVVGNRIGTDENGAAAAANGKAGIYVGGSASETYINNNLISGNTWGGVWLQNAGVTTITFNYIGTNISGTAAIPNSEGVALTDGTADSMIGGWSSGDGNLISGNTHNGVHIQDGATRNTVEANRIGLNAAGTGAIPNGNAGVAMETGANDNLIGTAPSSIQEIAYNTREGIYIANSSSTTIGTQNRIYRNGLAGIVVDGSSAVSNALVPGQVYGNGGLPIDLGGDGHTPNGSQPPSGPNNWINYPVITSTVGSTIYGTACPNCRVYLYQARGNPAAAGGGGVQLGFTGTDSSGYWYADLSAYGTGLTSASIALEACDTSGNCSEMSPRPVVYLPVVLRQ